MDAKQIELSGRVIRHLVNPGSKSDHEVVALETDAGEIYTLRRSDGPSFGDTMLDGLVGSSITTEGVAIGDTLIMRDWQPRR